MLSTYQVECDRGYNSVFFRNTENNSYVMLLDTLTKVHIERTLTLILIERYGTTMLLRFGIMFPFTL